MDFQSWVEMWNERLHTDQGEEQGGRGFDPTATSGAPSSSRDQLLSTGLAINRLHH